MRTLMMTVVAIATQRKQSLKTTDIINVITKDDWQVKKVKNSTLEVIDPDQTTPGQVVQMSMRLLYKGFWAPVTIRQFFV